MSENKMGTGSQGKGLSRRSFMKGLAATGIAFAAVSSGANKLARADSYGNFTAAADLSKEKLLWMHETMLKARHFDLFVVDKMVTGDKLVLERYPMLHCCPGQEASAVGVIAAMTLDDWCFTTHRNTVHDIARGMDMGKMMGTAIYKENSYTRGRGNHFHISSTAHKVPNMEGIIGMACVTAAGTAYGQMILNQRDGTNNVTVKFGGDGEYNCPDSFIGMNESAKFNLPMIFVCENNGQGIWVRTDETMKIKNVAERAAGVDMPAYVVDGQDVLAVYNVASEAIKRARDGGGPSFIETKTFRYFDHFGGRGYNPKKGVGAYGLFYRSDRELRHWLAKDPIANFRRTLINLNILDEQGADEMEAKAKQDVDKAWAWCLNQPNPTPESALDMAYADGIITKELPRQMADCQLYAGIKQA
jgi:pyruvate dehydrogenase E1 component alpha subunit